MNSTQARTEAAATDPPNEHAPAPAEDRLSEKRLISHLLWFFALVYIVEGLGQVVGLIAQPLTYYLKQVHGWTPVQVTAFITLFNVPWVIKPVYGLISDFVPLFGYRRKSYLLIANVAAIGGYFLGHADRHAERARLCADDDRLRHGDFEHVVRRGAGGERPKTSRERDTSSISNGCGSTSPPWRRRSSAASSSSTCRPLRPCMSRRVSSQSLRLR